MNRPNELGAAAALDIQRLQRSGYRGPVLVRDPISENVAVFDVHDRGCKPLGNFPYKPDAGEEHLILMMPELDLSEAITPKEVFGAVEKQVRRLSRWTVPLMRTNRVDATHDWRSIATADAAFPRAAVNRKSHRVPPVAITPAPARRRPVFDRGGRP